jgi:hypothetical protein
VDLDLGNDVIRMINTSKQDTQNLQDMEESKVQDGAKLGVKITKKRVEERVSRASY